jgi:hypothetical protein
MSKRGVIEISIHLPLYYNPDPTGGKRRHIEQSKFKQTYQEILEKFGGYSLFKQVKGVWMNQAGKIFTDYHYVLCVLTEDSPQTRQWLRKYKSDLAKRFEQEEIFIKVAQAWRI